MTKLLLILALGAAIWWLWTNGRKSGTRLAGKADRHAHREAARLLGVDEKANREEIVTAHRRLIERVHPDAGGSADLASEVNRARDILLMALGTSDKSAH